MSALQNLPTNELLEYLVNAVSHSHSTLVRCADKFDNALELPSPEWHPFRIGEYRLLDALMQCLSRPDFHLSKCEPSVQALLIRSLAFLSGAMESNGRRFIVRRCQAKFAKLSQKTIGEVCEYVHNNFAELSSILPLGLVALFGNLAVAAVPLSAEPAYELVAQLLADKLIMSSESMASNGTVKCACLLVKHLSVTLFEQSVVSALERALLRSAEVTTALICAIICAFNFEKATSALIERIVKAVGPQLFSSDQARVLATRKAFEHLQNYGAASSVIASFLIQSYSGSGSLKLTNADQKLCAISVLSSCATTLSFGFNNSTTASDVIAKLKPLIKAEQNEVIASELLVCYTSWLKPAQVSDYVEVTSFVKSLYLSKTSTPLIRAAALRCLVVMDDSASLVAVADSMIGASLTKAKGQTGVVASALEIFAAALAALRLICIDSKMEPKFAKSCFEILLTDQAMENHLRGDKFFSSVQPWGLSILIKLVELLFVRFSTRVEQKVDLFARPLAFGICSSLNQLRGEATLAFQRIATQSPLGGLLAASCLSSILALPKDESVSLMPIKLIRCGSYLPVLLNVCQSLQPIAASIGSLPSALLRLSSSAEICCYVAPAKVFQRLVSKVVPDCENYIAENAPSLLKATFSTFESNLQPIALSIVMNLCPLIAISNIVNLLSTSLSNPALRHVTVDELHIAKTPEGTLYNQSLLDAIFSGDDVRGNIKRESKAYSYKDQLADLELRKELAKTRRDVSKLSGQQKARLDEALAGEAAIRAKVNALQEAYSRDIRLANYTVRAIQAGDETAVELFAANSCRLVSALCPLLKAPMTNREAGELLSSVSKCIFGAANRMGYLSNCVATAYCRLACAASDVRDWPIREEPWIKMKAELHFSKLFQLFLQHKLDSARFSFVFPLFNLLIWEQTSDSPQPSWSADFASVLAYSTAFYGNAKYAKHLPKKDFLALVIHSLDVGLIDDRQASRIFIEIFRALLSLSDEINEELFEVTVDDYMLHTSPLCRLVVLETLSAVGLELLKVDPSRLPDLAAKVLILRYDASEHVRQLAERVWTSCKCSLLPELVAPILKQLHHFGCSDELRESAASALATIVASIPLLSHAVCIDLMATYHQSLPTVQAKLKDEFGRPLPPAPPDEASLDREKTRLAVAKSFEKVSSSLPREIVQELFEFFVPNPLTDPSVKVREAMLAAAISVLTSHNESIVDVVLPIFERFLANSSPTDASLDSARRGVVVLTATVARHLAKDDQRVRKVMEELMAALSTPSESVQIAVAQSMAPLMKTLSKDELPGVVDSLSKLLLDGETPYAERRGSAYGLASVVKGFGIVALKQFNVTAQLQAALDNKKDYRQREGALMAHEVICRMLGPIYEPYVVALLPSLLNSFGDTQKDVRQAADECAKEVMSKLSSHGVKLVLPMLIEGLKQEAWRTKCGSAELLGSMAYCAPAQLSACLPQIVPQLMEVVNDSHAKVAKSGEMALQQIGSVIKNPEIQALSSLIIEALLNPLEKSAECLRALKGTRLVHRLDAPSLALIMPVLQRALTDSVRSTEARRSACSLIVSIRTQTDVRDFEPYIPSILPGVRQSLLDPAPDVRQVASKALGALAGCFSAAAVQTELFPWLLETLVSETSSANRSGAAQGMCEVVGILGPGELERIVSNAVTVTCRPDVSASARDGYLMLFIHLPQLFGEAFSPYVQVVVPAILRGLSDESETVRATALRAGQRIIELYADKAKLLFVPELEKGIVNDNWRIRHSSVILLGEFLCRVADVTGDMTTETADEDDTFGSEMSYTRLAEALGTDMTLKVLAALFFCRSDVALVVRQASLHIWKLVVPNTPKALRDIAPVLLRMLIDCYASQNEDKINIASRTLGEVVRKLGDRMLGDVIAIMDSSLRPANECDVTVRSAVCMALSEVITNASRDHLHAFFKQVASPIRRAMLDPDPSVRLLAARTFSSLHAIVGSVAVAEMVTPLCDGSVTYSAAENEYALDALAQIMVLKSKVIMPALLPHLLQPVANTRALAMIADAAGDAFAKSMPIIVPALLDAVVKASKDSLASRAACVSECQRVLLATQDDDMAKQTLSLLLAASNLDSNPEARVSAAMALLGAFIEKTDLEVSDQAPSIFRPLILLCRSSNVGLLDDVWNALDILVSKRMSQEDYLVTVNCVKQTVHMAIGNSKPPLPGFVLSKKAVKPLLPVYRDCLLSGSPDIKELAALGLEEVVAYSDEATLKSQVINVTGPLIRVLGDRFGPTVKTAIIGAIDALLRTCGPLLKPFIPQLQTTFSKSLVDTNKPLRQRAAQAYAGLAAIHMKPENLITELTNVAKANAAEPGIRESVLQTIRNCVAACKCPDGAAHAVKDCIFQLFANHVDVTTRKSAAGCIGALLVSASDEAFNRLITENILSGKNDDWSQIHFRLICLQPMLASNSNRCAQRTYDIANLVKVAFGSNFSNQANLLHPSAARVAVGLLNFLLQKPNTQIDFDLVSVSLADSLKRDAVEVREVVAGLLYWLGLGCSETAASEDSFEQVVAVVAPQLVMGTKEKSTTLRRACELALVELLRLRNPTKSRLTGVLGRLDSGMRETLQELYQRSLKRLSEQPRPSFAVFADETCVES